MLGKVRFVGLVALLVGLVATMTFTASTKEDVIIVGTTDGITSLDTADSYDYWTWHVFQNTAQGLVDLAPQADGTLALVGNLAENWTVSADGKVYTFKLRNGVKFWDGSDFNAQAMKFAIDRALTLRGPAGGVDVMLAGVVSTEAVDASTFKITLDGPSGTFLSRLTQPPAYAVSPQTTPADRLAVDGSSEILYAGTGPYKLSSYEADVRTVYESFPGYWNTADAPRTAKVITQFFNPGAASQLAAAVRAGDIDVAFHTLNPEDVIALKNDPNVKVLDKVPSLNIRYMVINVTRSPFDDVRIRKAIALAVDRKAIVDKVFFGINQPLLSMVPPGFSSHVDAFPERDLAQAKALAQAYATEKGLTLPLSIKLTATTRYGDSERDVAVVVARSLEETGAFRVNLEILERVVFFDRLDQGQLDFLMLGWFPDFIDADNFLAPWLLDAPKALGTYFDELHPQFEEYKALFEQERTSSDQAVRDGIFKQLQQLTARDYPLIPLWVNTLQNIAATRVNVSGVEIDASATFRTWKMVKQ